MSEEQQTQAQKPKKFIGVKIIAIVSLVFGVSIMFALVSFISPLTGSQLKHMVSQEIEIIKIIMGIALLIGGFGLLGMRKWGIICFFDRSFDFHYRWFIRDLASVGSMVIDEELGYYGIDLHNFSSS